MDNKEKYAGMGTKVSPAMAEVINSICDSLGVDVYHLLQQFLYTLVRASSPEHELSPEIQKILTMMESDAGWQNALNLCNPDGLSVSQCILILEQKDKKGFGMVMVDKPFMDSVLQTECVDDIIERVTEVGMHGIYRRLRRLGAKLGCHHLSDILLTMIDAQTTIQLDEEFRSEMQGRDDYADNGKTYAYGKKTKSKHRRTVDGETERQQRIMFGDDDRDTARHEARGWRDSAKELEDSLGCRPFTDEA